MIAIIGLVLVILGATGAALGAWAAVNPPVGPFVVDEAIDVQVITTETGRRVISYRTPLTNPPWYITVAARLTSSGWTPPDVLGPPQRINLYTRVSSYWLFVVVEEAEMDGTPVTARITVLRRIYLTPLDRLIPW